MIEDQVAFAPSGAGYDDGSGYSGAVPYAGPAPSDPSSSGLTLFTPDAGSMPVLIAGPTEQASAGGGIVANAPKPPETVTPSPVPSTTPAPGAPRGTPGLPDLSPVSAAAEVLEGVSSSAPAVSYRVPLAAVAVLIIILVAIAWEDRERAR